MSAKNQHIGIIGVGFIGSVLRRYFPEAKVYDTRPGNWDDLTDVMSQDYIFLSVNFLDNGAGIEQRALLDAYFDVAPAGRIIIIKSTFTPGTTEYFQARHPHLIFCYNPEFLTENTAWEDFVQPPFQILGVTEQSAGYQDELFDILPPAPLKRTLGSREAEVLKHSLNSFFATKVIFFNQLYDACQMLNTEYEAVREILVKHPWVGDSHSTIWHKGYRGFGGKCLPKDIAALTKAAPLPLFQTVMEVNEMLRAAEADNWIDAAIPARHQSGKLHIPSLQRGTTSAHGATP